MEPLVWPILLLLLALLFVGLELMLPTGGVLGVLAGVSACASIYVGFLNGPWYGLITIALVLVILPIATAIALHYWPRTPLGRRLFLQPARSDDEVLPQDDYYHQLQLLMGKFGVAKSKMLPSGAVRIEGKTYDAVSRGNPIEAGAPVRVVSVQGNHVVVAPASQEEWARAVSDDEAMTQSLESLGIDSSEDPLA
jgi:membrane-bound ClpP family serine protease